jgi:peptidylprolyl isomerase
MKHFVLLLSLAAFAGAASAQTPSSPAAPKPANSSPAPSKSATASGSAPASASGATAAVPPWIKLPAGIPHAVHGPVKIAVALRYEDIKVGAGPLGESGKLWHVKYTGWRAADGIKFDSWDDHKQPVMKDGKPQTGPDGKPVLGDPTPLVFPQGMGRLIPGFDYAVEGMHIGGKRRIFIPWQLAYGTRTIPDRPDHPGIPAKSDLIFDVELVDMTDMPAPPQRPIMPPHPGAPGAPPAPGAAPGTNPGSNPGSNPGAAPGAPSAPAAPSATPKPALPTTPPPPQGSTAPSSSAPPPTQQQPPPSATSQPQSK